MAFVSVGLGSRGAQQKRVAGVTMCEAESTRPAAMRTRREVLSAAAALLVAAGASATVAPYARAAESATVAPPADTKFVFKLTGDYKADATAVLGNMRNVTGMARGTPGMADNVASTRKTMNDFVAQYRRNGKVSGSVSFSTLYTAINTLSGHFQSYGNSYPVPEKRRKRLNSQYSEIEKALARNR
mmetsp:Transcript_13547/g.36392  ORF Transcript_13547/g.36392 Transcript_13547/m.36392 type:complete len:186 (+) Transcript_13547:156-713(+)|eukprot:CAMPEP_0185838508 /NCGR_PEP_ID=MMETSP1353-20130828/13137_1 /TAXON_ID=1077150 /ORGANISM="Erythrolobus australicus, Strain CCMP3124" /LENGTH=185 /DNA_ID=CAMNT_0028537571 /DNA_START=138 /DNA_END=695 /DNA_ORIENTATION=+